MKKFPSLLPPGREVNQKMKPNQLFYEKPAEESPQPPKREPSQARLQEEEEPEALSPRSPREAQVDQEQEGHFCLKNSLFSIFFWYALYIAFLNKLTELRISRAERSLV